MALNLTRFTYEIQESRFGNIICYPDDFTSEQSGQTQMEAGTASSAVSFFITQLFVSNLSYRVFYYLTRPLYLPPLVAQILCGLLFSPSLLGQTTIILQHVFPYRYSTVLETFANLALVYNIFLMGLEMDLRMVKRIETKPLVIAIFGAIVSGSVGAGLYMLNGINDEAEFIPAGLFFWCIALSCTNFPELARMLADLKLLRTDMGRTAMSAAMLSDLMSWVLLVFGFACFNKKGGWSIRWYQILLSSIAFFVFCWYAIRPLVAWLLEKTTKGRRVGDTHVWFVLGAVMFFGLLSDGCGVHSSTGAFVFGLLIPNDHIIRNMIEEKLHDFLAGILMPLFFIICGLRVNLHHVHLDVGGLALVTVLVVATLVKMLTTFAISSFMNTPTRDAIAFGALMNTKGILALVILNAGRDTKAVDSIYYTLMVLVFLAISMFMEPFLAWTYKPKKSMVHYKYRTIQTIKGDTEFRVLACVHVLQNASGMTNILQISNPTNQSPINVFAIHLVELTGRTTAASMLIMNDEYNKPKANFSDRVRAESDQIAETFEILEVNSKAMMVQTVTAVSPYTTMHEDICTLAEDKQVCFILLPYHKHLMADGRMGEGNASHADVNTNVLNNAPCSVGILVDRGIVLTLSDSTHGDPSKKHVVTLFIGGPDDREALSYAWRMVGDYTVKLTVVRFVPGREALLSSGKSGASFEREKQVDDESIYEFNFKTMNEAQVTYIEKVVNDGQETIATIRDLDENNSFDLYVVGRGYGTDSPVTAGLSDWSSSPELGTIGDTLASSNFTMHASVLVIQQYTANRQATDATGVGDKGLGENQKKSSDAEPMMKSMYEDDEDDDDYHYNVHRYNVVDGGRL